MFHRVLVILAAAAMPAVASAELRDYCPDRPGIGTPSCTIDAGHTSVELGLADWTRTRNSDEHSDQWLLGDVLIRYGIADHAEVQIGWAGYGFDRDRSPPSAARDTRQGAGDVRLALRRNLAHPDGSGFSIAMMPMVTLPVGHRPIGEGDWGASFDLPMSYELNDRFSLEFVPEVAVAVDEDGHGRHWSEAAVAGLATKFGEKLTLTSEYRFENDRDPGEHQNLHMAGLSIAMQPKDGLQFDVGANKGLSHAAADIAVYFGVSRRF